MDSAMASPSPSSSSSSSSVASSSSMSSASSSIHPASLVDASLHSPHTLRLVNIKISKQIIEHVVDQVVETVDFAMGKTPSPTPRGRSTTRTPHQTKFTTFVSTVLTRAEITTPTLLATLIYITRARPYLHIALEEWALERVFLGALITASKYLNDSTLKNVHWALCTGVFGKRDVGRIEREFLAVLDWELGVSENEILGLWQGLEWAVEMEETEERRVREREAKKRLAAVAELEKQEKRKQQKLFYFSSASQRAAATTEFPEQVVVPAAPAVSPPKPRNHRRRSNAASSAQHRPSLPHHSHSSSSSSTSSSSSSSPSSSSSSSSSDSASPQTPADFDLAYPEPEELARIQKMQVSEQHEHPIDVDVVEVHHVAVPPAKRCLKRSITSTMELLKSFPFPGHHHHHQQQQDSQTHRRSS